MRELNKNGLKLIILVGLTILISGISLIAVYLMDYGYSRETVQYSEFLTVFRSGGGDSSPEHVYYKNTLPLSANVSDLSVINLHFNISTLNKTSFWVPVQLIIALSQPGFPMFSTTWTDNYNVLNYQDFERIWKNFGIFTPRNITIYSMELILDIFTNNTNYTFNWCFPYERYTEENGTLVGRVHYIESLLNYGPGEGFVFYIPDDNKTILYPQFNSDLSWNFSLTAFWDVSFHQLIGSNANFVGNATLAEWVFKNESADVVSVDIRFDNSNYNTPIPVYTIVQRDPWIEITLIVIGSVTVAIVYIYDLKVNKPRKDHDLD